MPRPSGVTLTAALMALLTLVGIAIALTMPTPAIPAGTPLSASTMGSFVIGGAILGAVISAVFIFLYWKGYGWMRWVVMVYSLYEVVKLVFIKKTWDVSHPAAFLSIASALLAVYLLVYLNSEPARTWFNSPKTEPLA